MDEISLSSISSGDSEISGVKKLSGGSSDEVVEVSQSAVEDEETLIYGRLSDEDDNESSDSESAEHKDDPQDVTWEPSLGDIQLAEDSLVTEDLYALSVEEDIFDVSMEIDDGVESDEGDEEELTSLLPQARSGYLRLDDAQEGANAIKGIAYLKCLIQLAEMNTPQICEKRNCHKPVKRTHSQKGTSIIFLWTCTDGHVNRRWCSQPKLPRGVLAGDFTLAAAILLSGNNFRKIALLFNFMPMGCISANSFTRIQALYCFPAIQAQWDMMMNQTTSSVQDRNVVIAGDGRMDSPGFCAKYCTYTTVDAETMDILDMQVVDKREVDLKSPNMELHAFKAALTTLKGKGMKVVEVVTDAHPSISAYMRKKHEDKKHSYDMWHGAKNLSKKITAAGSNKAAKGVLQWRKDVVSHFWHSCEESGGDEMVLRDRWSGVVHHVVGEHEWALGACEHGDIESSKEYLTAGSPAHKALTEVVFDDRFLRNMKYYVNHRSTADLEGFQNHILMYAGKRFAYSKPSYKARCQLAGLDYQQHKGRVHKKTTAGKLRWHRAYNKNSQRWRPRPVMEEKTYKYIPSLLADIIQLRLDDKQSITRKVDLQEDDPRRVSKTIAPIPPPSTEELVQESMARLKKQPEPTQVDRQ